MRDLADESRVSAVRFRGGNSDVLPMADQRPYPPPPPEETMSFESGQHPAQPRRLRARRLSFVAAVWLGATSISFIVAAKTAIGPVVLRFTKSHGVHVGDLVCFAGCYMSALVLTVKILRSDRQKAR